MADDGSDMEIRKFLKRVGVECHEAIAAALAGDGGDELEVKMVLHIGVDGAPAKTFEATLNKH
jgi:hypothetical protein